MKNEWWRKKAAQIQQYAGKNDARNFFQSIKEIYGPVSHKPSQVLTADGVRLLREPEEISQRWEKHFHMLLNRPSNASVREIHHQPCPNQTTTLCTLEQPLSDEEVGLTISQIKEGKTPEGDNIPGKLLKRVGITIRQATYAQSPIGSMGKRGSTSGVEECCLSSNIQKQRGPPGLDTSSQQSL